MAKAKQKTDKDRATYGSVEKVKAAKSITKNLVKLRALEVEMVEPKKLKPNLYNPNKQDEHEFEMLVASVRGEGFTLPILANRLDSTIIDGEHRWRAAIAVGLKKVPVVYLDLDEVQMQLATIRHNKATGTHDAGLEALVLADINTLMGPDFIEKQLLIDKATLDEALAFETAPDLLAGEEFEQAWIPVKGREIYTADEAGNLVNIPRFLPRNQIDGALVMKSNTPDANNLAFENFTKDPSSAKKAFYTVSAVFTVEEAQEITAILEDPQREGETPAERLYFIAKEAQNA